MLPKKTLLPFRNMQYIQYLSPIFFPYNHPVNSGELLLEGYLVSFEAGLLQYQSSTLIRVPVTTYLQQLPSTHLHIYMLSQRVMHGCYHKGLQCCLQQLVGFIFFTSKHENIQINGCPHFTPPFICPFFPLETSGIYSKSKHFGLHNMFF